MKKIQQYEKTDDYICLLKSNDLELEDSNYQKILFKITLCIHSTQKYDDEIGHYLEYKLKESNYSLSYDGYFLLSSNKILNTEQKFKYLFNHIKNNRGIILKLVGLAFN